MTSTVLAAKVCETPLDYRILDYHTILKDSFCETISGWLEINSDSPFVQSLLTSMEYLSPFTIFKKITETIDLKPGMPTVATEDLQLPLNRLESMQDNYAIAVALLSLGDGTLDELKNPVWEISKETLVRNMIADNGSDNGRFPVIPSGVPVGFFNRVVICLQIAHHLRRMIIIGYIKNKELLDQESRELEQFQVRLKFYCALINHEREFSRDFIRLLYRFERAAILLLAIQPEIHPEIAVCIGSLFEGTDTMESVQDCVIRRAIIDYLTLPKSEKSLTFTEAALFNPSSGFRSAKKIKCNSNVGLSPNAQSDQGNYNLPFSPSGLTTPMHNISFAIISPAAASIFSPETPGKMFETPTFDRNKKNARKRQGEQVQTQTDWNVMNESLNTYRAKLQNQFQSNHDEFLLTSIFQLLLLKEKN